MSTNFVYDANGWNEKDNIREYFPQNIFFSIKNDIRLIPIVKNISDCKANFKCIEENKGWEERCGKDRENIHFCRIYYRSKKKLIEK